MLDSYRLLVVLAAVATSVGCGSEADGVDDPKGAQEIDDDGLDFSLAEELDEAAALTLSSTSSVFAWDPVGTPGPEYQAQRTSLLSRCDAFIDKLVAAPGLTRFVDEGKPASDPARQRSKAVWDVLDDAAIAVGYCARLPDTAASPNPARSRARAALFNYGNKWIATYKGGATADASNDDDPGNPINEYHILPLVFAWDMIYPQLTSTQRRPIRDFLIALDDRVASFMGAMTPSNDNLYNNWMTDALVIRLTAALVARETNRAESLRVKLNAFVRTLLTAPSNWSTPECDNIAAVGAYGSYDLQQRDAFTYHMKSMTALLRLVAFRRSLVTSTTLGRLNAGVTLMRDYVSGAESHKEFVCTTASYDLGNPLRNTVWSPTSAKIGFRFARLVFPSHRAWLGAFGGSDYSAWVKVFASGRGDRVL